MADNAHIIFVKYPEPGKVKTRLGKTVGYEKASAIYKRIAENLINKSCKTCDTMVFIEPYSRLEDFKDWIGDKRFLPQTGSDLGERMYNALQYAFDAGYGKAVLTGSDIPGLNSSIIKDAFSLLDERDAVIGKAEDGGYYLIGFSFDTFTDRAFSNINWSTDIVFSQTMNILKKIGYSAARNCNTERSGHIRRSGKTQDQG